MRALSSGLTRANTVVAAIAAASAVVVERVELGAGQRVTVAEPEVVADLDGDRRVVAR